MITNELSECQRLDNFIQMMFNPLTVKQDRF